MKQVLVLGAGGFIGRELCKKLSESWKVRAFDLSDMSELRTLENVECITGNYLEIRDYGELLEGVDAVINLICTSLPKESTSQIPNEIETNLVPLAVLLENLVKYGIENYVFISSAGTVYGEGVNNGNEEGDVLNPICSYGVLKKVSESYIDFYNTRYKKNFRVVRISNLYGVGQSIYKHQGIIPIFINSILEEKPITVYGDGENRRDYIYIDDAIEGIIASIEYNGKETVFNIANGDNYTINEIIDKIEKQTGRHFIEVRHCSERLCDVKQSIINVKRAERELGWRAKTNIETGIAKVVNMLDKENKHDN